MRKAFILFACAILCAGLASAQSTESVCDGEQGAGYGLCNAFCDAMDCDSEDPQASATACDKVKSKYQQITGNEPPCLPQCVCNQAIPGFLDAVSSTITDCIDLGIHYPLVYLLTPDGSLPSAFAHPGLTYCGFEGTSPRQLLYITMEEALSCNAFLRARAAAAGVTCHM
jgi:hypothetical protein